LVDEGTHFRGEPEERERERLVVVARSLVGLAGFLLIVVEFQGRFLV
jgi:hypothetical protein